MTTDGAFSRDHVTYLSVEWPAATSHYSVIIIRVVRVLAKSISKHPALVYSNHQVSNDISYVLLSLWVRLKVVTSQITHHRGRLVPMPPKRLKYLVYDPKQHKTAGKCHRELQAHRWMENEKTRKGYMYAKRPNKELAQALVKWMTPDPRWKGLTPVKSASAWVKASADFHVSCMGDLIIIIALIFRTNDFFERK